MDSKDSAQVVALGAEAASFAAIDSGVKGVFGYPGTPSTEVIEGVKEIISSLDDGRVSEWAANEKVAYEMALGLSYTGHRSMVVMKHVGLNVAMDAFVNSAMTGVRGGLVVVVADDPSMHSSQNEQDSRYLADFAHVPCFEPSTLQEVYDLTCKAFDISEKEQLPIVLRLVTRLSHSRGMISRGAMKDPGCIGKPPEEEIKNWILVPAFARERYKALRNKLGEMTRETDRLNKVTINKNRIGVVTAGMGKAYFDQLCSSDHEIRTYNRLDIMGYPVNSGMMEELLSNCDKVFVFEEDYPYLEDKLIALSKEKNIHGRRDGTLPFAGELNPLNLRTALGIDVPEVCHKTEMELPLRPPRLCDGCGHIDTFKAMNAAFKNLGIKDQRVFGDIGCYALGVQPQYNSLHTCVEMGASVGMALGAAYGEVSPAVGVLGDSTFFHSGLPTLISIAKTKVNVNLIVLDNQSTAMTGQQETIALDILPAIAKGAGFDDDHIHTLIPLPKFHEENVKRLEKIFSHDGPDFIIFKRECVQSLRKKANIKKR